MPEVTTTSTRRVSLERNIAELLDIKPGIRYILELNHLNLLVLTCDIILLTEPQCENTTFPSNPHHIHRKRGSTMAPKLFTVALQRMMESLDWEGTNIS
ncbi:hypothetical protein KIN20_003792 [Parelaphostrongylus tenuis]|uniref:Uncharacterized protein n=1 Tax=Parelaphostrongylus tenuis TaxID=148309 RepID=A0AAD5MIY2_PARTN|nr:hypothetical protein KIN20_003792 [Parelaphostrongylus tenuis]